MTEPEELQDPRAMDDEELAQVPDPPSPADPSIGTTEVEGEGAPAGDPDGAHRDEPAGEDYAGSGF